MHCSLTSRLSLMETTAVVNLVVGLKLLLEQLADWLKVIRLVLFSVLMELQIKYLWLFILQQKQFGLLSSNRRPVSNRFVPQPVVLSTLILSICSVSTVWCVQGQAAVSDVDQYKTQQTDLDKYWFFSWEPLTRKKHLSPVQSRYNW